MRVDRASQRGGRHSWRGPGSDSPRTPSRKCKSGSPISHSDQFTVRKTATGELERFRGPTHEDLLREALKQRRLVGNASAPGKNPRPSLDSERLRRNRMLEVLEHHPHRAGTPVLARVGQAERRQHDGAARRRRLWSVWRSCGTGRRGAEFFRGAPACVVAGRRTRYRASGRPGLATSLAPPVDLHHLILFRASHVGDVILWVGCHGLGFCRGHVRSTQAWPRSTVAMAPESLNPNFMR